MSDEENSGQLKIAASEVPIHWDSDPMLQLRALQREIAMRCDHPEPETGVFMAAAKAAIHRLPDSYFPLERAEALIEISRFYYLDGQCELAIQAVSAAVRAAVKGGHRVAEGRSRTAHATCLRENFDYYASLCEYTLALEIFRAEGCVEHEAKALNNLGNLFRDVGLYSEALLMFERIASFFQATGDPMSQQMALDNAAIAALRLGDVKRGVALAERAAEIWPGGAETSRDLLFVVQGAAMYCELLIQANRLDEAEACARLAQAAATRSGLSQAKGLADIASSVAAYSLGSVDFQSVELAIARAERDSPSMHLIALEAAIRACEHAGQLDRALMLQHELLTFNKRQRFEEVRRALGRPSPQEAEGTTRLARLGVEIDRRVADFTRLAIDQALRSGFSFTKVFRVSRLAQMFAAHQGFPEDRVQQVGLAAKLIDIGMIVLPDDLMSKPRELTVGERRLVEKHAEIGADLLSNARLALFQPCVSLIRFHHERWDGTGPCALKGDAIPLEARVISLCDVFEALRHDRPWRRAYSSSDALRMISELAGTVFDPLLTARFVDWLREQYRLNLDFESQLADGAQENDYVRLRERISRLLDGVQYSGGPRMK